MKKCIPVSVIFILSIVFTSTVFAHYEHFKIPKATITIDGNSDDWNDIEPLYVDDVNDQYIDADYDGTDLYKLYLAKDDTFLYIMMFLYDGAPREKDSIDRITTYNICISQARDTSNNINYVAVGAYHDDGAWHATVGGVGETSEWSHIADYPSRFVGVGSNFIEWKVYLDDIGTLNGRFICYWIQVENTSSPSDGEDTQIHIVDEDTTTTTPTPTATATPTLTPSPTPKASPTPAGTGIVYGTVTNEEGFAFKNVSVSLTGTNDYSENTKTDKEGYYEFTGLAAGDYTLTYEKDGYQTKTQEVSLEEDETLELETIYMERTEKGTISGYVTSIYGDPIESVKLKLKGIRTKAIKIESTDADGFFEFADLEADDYMITATKKRYRSARKTVTIEEGDATEIEIEMRKTSKRRILMSKQQTQDCRL